MEMAGKEISFLIQKNNDRSSEKMVTKVARGSR
jgi:hypothetical protein